MGQQRSTEVDVSEVQEYVVRDLFDENGKMMNTDQRLAEAAEKYAGGFGGYYFHDTDKSMVYVYMLDTSETEAAKKAFQSADRSKHQVTQMIPVQGQYAFDDLVRWFHDLDDAMVAAGIHPTTGAVLEVSNRIHFGLEDMDQVTEAREIMGTLDIPAGAVIFEQADPLLLADRDSVKAKWRPVAGGTKHNIMLGNDYCTLGFVTERNNVDGVVVASHCTNEDGDIGGVAMRTSTNPAGT